MKISTNIQKSKSQKRRQYPPLMEENDIYQDLCLCGKVLVAGGLQEWFLWKAACVQFIHSILHILFVEKDKNLTSSLSLRGANFW